LEGIASGKELSSANMPAYVHTLNNFQDFMVTIDRKDWQKSLQISQNRYFNNSQSQGESVAINKKIGGAGFREVENMHGFV